MHKLYVTIYDTTATSTSTEWFYDNEIQSCIWQFDTSKAFDRINHWKMFKPLILRDVSVV